MKGSETLIGKTICITSDLITNEVLTYGASLSHTLKRNKKIILAVSCLHTWHPLVSYAVMCQTQRVAKVSINLQNISASCTAYDVNTLEEKPPCHICQEMFSLEGNLNEDSSSKHLPGNCAEAEAISKLLQIKNINMNQTNIELIANLGHQYPRHVSLESIYMPLE